MDNHTILGVHIRDRQNEAAQVQDILSKHGLGIRTRLGLHDTDGTHPQPTGLLLLEMVGSAETTQELANQLNALEGVEVKSLVFTH